MGLRYLLRRLAVMVPVFLVVVTVVFFMIRFAPGGPFDTEKQVPAEILANLNAKYHLDEPLWKQYFRYLNDLVARAYLLIYGKTKIDLRGGLMFLVWGWPAVFRRYLPHFGRAWKNATARQSSTSSSHAIPPKCSPRSTTARWRSSEAIEWRNVC